MSVSHMAIQDSTSGHLLLLLLRTVLMTRDVPALVPHLSPPPSFVGEDYFCDSGVRSEDTSGFYPDDPFWDGEGCSSSSSCCSFNNPPYFTKTLPSPTSDPIEARLCRWESIDDTPVEFMELYVK